MNNQLFRRTPLARSVLAEAGGFQLRTDLYPEALDFAVDEFARRYGQAIRCSEPDGLVACCAPDGRIIAVAGWRDRDAEVAGDFATSWAELGLSPLRTVELCRLAAAADSTDAMIWTITRLGLYCVERGRQHAVMAVRRPFVPFLARRVGIALEVASSQVRVDLLPEGSSKRSYFEQNPQVLAVADLVECQLRLRLAADRAARRLASSPQPPALAEAVQ